MQDYSKALRKHRKRRGVSRVELGKKLGFAGADAIFRRELRPKDKRHVAMTPKKYTDAIAAVEAIVEEQGGEPDPAEALE